jgi:lysophospholipase L1-like esterase
MMKVLGGVVLGGAVWVGACVGGSAQVTASPTTPVEKQLAAAQAKLEDWPQLGRYAADDATLESEAADKRRVVFFGDSITDAWGRRPGTGTFFPGEPYVNRGISGQTTAQMVVRFQQDVVDLHPQVVLILAGTNDVAGNTGPMTAQMTLENFRAMVEMARANNIRAAVASILPTGDFPWRKGLEPAPKIRALNQQLKAYCESAHVVWVDYYSVLADADGAMKPGLSVDGVHPNAAGYALMAPLAEAGIKQALRK